VRINGAIVAAPSSLEEAVGEDVAPIEIGGYLDLVDGEAVDGDVQRHRLDGRHPVAGLGRNDALLAGHKGDRVLADTIGDAAIDLTGEQTQRQTDHARAMRQHALEGEEGLAGVGGPEDGLEGRGVGHLPAYVGEDGGRA
jgi:hypothetical protein